MAERDDILGIETPDPTNVLMTRLEHWRHAAILLQDYLDSQIYIQKNISSGLEKTRKNINEAPRFDFSSTGNELASPTSPTAGVGGGDGAAGGVADVALDSNAGETDAIVQPGIAESFQQLRVKNEELINKSQTTEAALKSSVLPMLETLKGDIERHIKGMKGTSVKGMKEVEKAKIATRKAVESLGQFASSSSGRGQKIDHKSDPFVLHRLALNAAGDQVSKENAQTDAALSSQKNFLTLERHIVQVLQQAMSVIAQIQSDYASASSDTYTTIAETFGAIQEDHEWSNFTQREARVIVPDNVDKLDMSRITFSNNDHPSVKPVMQGILQRKGKLTRSYDSDYYVLTASNWLHSFKSQDYLTYPTPDWSLYVPEATLGAADTIKNKFTLQGKIASKTAFKQHSYQFKCVTHGELVQWHEALKNSCQSYQASGDGFMSPVTSRPTTSEGLDSDVSSPTTPTAAGAAGTQFPIAEQPGQQNNIDAVVAGESVQTQAPPHYIDTVNVPSSESPISQPVGGQVNTQPRVVEQAPVEQQPVAQVQIPAEQAAADPALSAARQAAGNPQYV